MSAISFTVRGKPEPQGSLKGYCLKCRSGRVRLTSDNPALQDWRDVIGDEARSAMTGRPPLGRAVIVEATFHFARPKGHFGARGLLPSAPAYPAKKPDIDKVTRGLLDALTSAAVLLDDAQVVGLAVTKVYSLTPGVEVSVVEVSE